MLEKLKAEVLLAYEELSRYGLDNYARGIVSAIDRESGRIIMKSARNVAVADIEGNILEGSQALSSDIQSHIAIYRAFPKLGGVAKPHARYATIFAQIGMDIPVLGAFHKDNFCVEIPCADSTTEIGELFSQRHIDPLHTPGTLIVSDCAFAWGPTVLDAVNNAAALEETANMAYHTMQLDPGIQPIH